VLSVSDMSAAAKAEAPPGKSNKLLIIIVLVFNVLLAAAVGYTVVMGQQKPAPKHAAEEHGEGAGAEHKFGPVIEVGELVANIDGPLSGHYIKVMIHVEAKNEEEGKRIEAAVVPIRSEALLFLNGLTPKDTSGQIKIKIIADGLQKRLNDLLGKDTVKKVYFAEFVVQ
jgi:flagellar protein FliL